VGFSGLTTYIEKIERNKLTKAVLRAYTYDKRHKELLPYDITRFEIKLQAKYFNKHGFSIESIEKTLDRYHVMYFENLLEKYTIMTIYDKYKTVQKREICRLGLEQYRIYADMDYISDFIDLILNVTDSDAYLLA